ncbi:hypothetical protein [Streptomyces sp. NPDC090022]|uniref:hypothetical protein n=1 Tax=Streptomyces sp. NPDC090022 TaxID=3365920 RepID=UPI0038212AF2
MSDSTPPEERLEQLLRDHHAELLRTMDASLDTVAGLRNLRPLHGATAGPRSAQPLDRALHRITLEQRHLDSLVFRFRETEHRLEHERSSFSLTPVIHALSRAGRGLDRIDHDLRTRQVSQTTVTTAFREVLTELHRAQARIGRDKRQPRHPAPGERPGDHPFPRLEVLLREQATRMTELRHTVVRLLAPVDSHAQDHAQLPCSLDDRSPG